MSFNKEHQTNPTPTPPITTEAKYSSGPYVRTSQDDNPSLTYSTANTHVSNTQFLGITKDHARLGKMLGNKATFKSKSMFKVQLNVFRAWQD